MGPNFRIDRLPLSVGWGGAFTDSSETCFCFEADSQQKDFFFPYAGCVAIESRGEEDPLLPRGARSKITINQTRRAQ